MALPPPQLDQLRHAQHVVVFTGAGESAESAQPSAMR